MLRIAITTAIIAIVIPLVAISGIIDDAEPVGMDVASATIRGKSVTVPVTNLSYEPITVEVTALYDDLIEVHAEQTLVSLAAKQTAMVTVTFSITDDINPQVSIIESPDPMEGAIAMSAVLSGN